MSGQERPNQPRLASLSPGKALSVDSLPHDTLLVGAVAKEKFLPAHARPAYARPIKAAAEAEGAGGEEESYCSGRSGEEQQGPRLAIKTEQMSMGGRKHGGNEGEWSMRGCIEYFLGGGRLFAPHLAEKGCNYKFIPNNRHSKLPPNGQRELAPNDLELQEVSRPQFVQKCWNLRLWDGWGSMLVVELVRRGVLADAASDIASLPLYPLAIKAQLFGLGTNTLPIKQFLISGLWSLMQVFPECNN
eukprot:1161862-Pelagomonas_calceolata.AAC.2